MSNEPWIGVDFDATLSTYEQWMGPEHTGDPIAPMVDRVKAFIKEGIKVKIFTARVWHNGSPGRMAEAILAARAIRAWCVIHLGQELEVTNIKDYDMIQLWDDRAIQVIPNTGRRADGEQ